MRRLKKKIFLGLFGGTVLLLGAVRLVCPEVTGHVEEEETPAVKDTCLTRETTISHTRDKDVSHVRQADTAQGVSLPSVEQDSAGRRKWHPVLSVPSYAACFPDVQDVQIVAAKQWGVSPVRNRQEAERRRKELVYIGANPFYCIDKGMTHSIPYLVPRASHLLSMIGRNYLDSLYVKGIPLHQIIVSSVLRTQDDVARLQQRNGNATEQSCHLFGTTFDICYNRFSTVSPPGEPERRAVQSDTLKWVLSEVLRDVREQGRCYIKYEVKQGCFHITVR
ncbi:MAG: hypothetical protein J6I86_06230 [Bacteroidaceae bacterium]|nr:hypothetical protein [Bacteroidaceae bacterium]